MTSDRPDTLQARLDGLGSPAADRVVGWVDAVLDDAAGLGVSDVHFEPTPAGLVVRYRVDGVLRSAAVLPRSLAANVIARLKVMAALLTYRLDVPQEGSIRGGDSRADRRVSVFPTVHGEKAVVRLYDGGPVLTTLADLGLADDISRDLDRLLRERTGAVFLTGPSGSGKTTTIYACLRRLAGEGRQTVTIEDPVEQLIDGVTQSQARPGTEFDFARGLRSLLRQDPEVIMVGEVRDRETAGIAVEAALTGHLVFTTLHAGSACGVIARLLEMGIEPYLLTTAVKGIVNQRLLRELCPDCRKSGVADPEPVGCPACLGTGFRGRFLVAELLVPDAVFRKAILARSDEDELTTAATQSGWRPLRVAADTAIAAGRTTRAEVDRTLGPAGKPISSAIPTE